MIILIVIKLLVPLKDLTTQIPIPRLSPSLPPPHSQGYLLTSEIRVEGILELANHIVWTNGGKRLENIIRHTEGDV